MKETVKLNPLGLGFGKPFLQPVLLPDLSTLDPVCNYIPHNTIYRVWMRLGPLGYLALCYLFGAMITMEIIVAYADYQLSSYRNVIYVGMLAGVLLRLAGVEKEAEQQ